MTRIQQHANRVGLAGLFLLGLITLFLVTSCATSRERRRIETRAYYDKRTVTTDTTEWPVKNDAASYGRPPLAPIPPRSFEVQRPVQHIGELQQMVNVPAAPPKRRLLGLLPPKATPSTNSINSGPLHQLQGVNVPQSVSGKRTVPRKCKGCTFYVAGGDQTNSTAGKKATTATGDGATTVTAAKKAQAAAADSGASLQQASSKQQAAAGEGAAAQDFTKQGQRGGAAASGEGAHAEATTEKPGLPWGPIVGGVVVGGFVIWLVFFGGAGVVAAAWRRKKNNDAA